MGGPKQFCLVNTVKKTLVTEDGATFEKQLVVIPTFNTDDPLPIKFFESVKQHVVHTAVGLRRDIQVAPPAAAAARHHHPHPRANPYGE